MIKIRQEDKEERTVNMMPLIDLVFLLLVYFMLTMTFVDEEKWMKHLLNNNGGLTTETVPIIPPEDINICIYPLGAEQFKSAEQTQQWFEDWESKPQVVVRIKSAKIVLNQYENKEKQLEKIHEFITTELMRYEDDMLTREKQDPVKVNCFSHLPWYYASAAYDAVRAHEQTFINGPYVIGREFSFAPREIHRYGYDRAGKELQRLTRLR